MSGFQFIHYEKYKKDDIGGIIGEASRTPGYCPHVENVQPPIVLKGNLQNLQERLQAEANAKYAEAEAVLSRFGLADVPPQQPLAPEAVEAAPEGAFRI